MVDLADSVSPPTSQANHGHQPRPVPGREHCWSEDATFTPIEAWGRRYDDLGRGNLRQKHWQEVADAVNGRRGHLNKKAHRKDVQCKNRIDTLKKKYKTEKARVLESDRSYRSQWPFFAAFDALIGSSPSALKKPSPAPSMSQSMYFSAPPVVMASAAAQQQEFGGPPMAIPLLAYRRSMTPVASVVPQKRPSPVAMPMTVDYSNLKKNYSAVAAVPAAAAAETDEVEENEEEVKELDDLKGYGQRGEAAGLRKLARAIEMFGKVYARVESEKHRRIVELEKQRMQLAKELECQRMQILVEMQVQLEKVKRAKKSNSNANSQRINF